MPQPEGGPLNTSHRPALEEALLFVNKKPRRLQSKKLCYAGAWVVATAKPFYGKWGVEWPQPVAQSSKSFLVRAGRIRFFSKKNRFT
jgi:hypothetical protein